jgi:hypothetical protein
VIQRGDNAGFAFEALARTWLQDLDRDGAFEASVAAFVDFAHAPGSNMREDLIGTNLSPTASSIRNDCILSLRTIDTSTTGEILGSVTDISGASVPGARITVTNEATNLQSPITSNAAGEYVTPFLQPGPYSVMVEMQGFQRQIRRGLILAVGQKLRIDFALAPGEVTEAV